MLQCGSIIANASDVVMTSWSWSWVHATFCVNPSFGTYYPKYLFSTVDGMLISNCEMKSVFFFICLHILKLMQLRVKWRETEWFGGMLFWACMCVSRCELQQNIFHFLCSFALLKYLKVISLHKSVPVNIWRERSLKPSGLLLLSHYFVFRFQLKRSSHLQKFRPTVLPVACL